MIFTRPKRGMNSYLSIFLILIIGFTVYFLLRDKLFDSEDTSPETFEVPSPTSIEVRQAPLYPPRTISSSGPNPPSQQAPSNEVVVYAQPSANDPYNESQESSEHPENLRHPERSFRPSTTNENTSMAVQSGIASETHQVSSDNAQMFQQEIIQGGGEFMPGIFANDTYTDTAYSSF